jgi:hypothetical protein
MAVDTTSPVKPAVLGYVDPDRPKGKALPALLLIAILIGLAYGAWRLVTYIQSIQSTEAVETKFVLRRLAESVRLFEPVSLFGTSINGKGFWLTLLLAIPLINVGFVAWSYYGRGQAPTLARWIISGLLFLPALWATVLALQPAGRATFLEIEGAFFWAPILTIVLALAVVYVVWMYVSDGRSVGWLWATFLGTLRIATYLILAGVFLLPALQNWERSEAFSRVLVIFDVSGSMSLSDDVSDGSGPPPVTRMDKVHKLLTEDRMSFLNRLEERNPVVAYAFGGKLDEEFKEFKKGGKEWTPAEWSAWLRLDLKLWVLDDLSDDGKRLLRASPGFEPEKPGTPEWADQWAKAALPADLSAEDKEKLEAKQKKVPARIELRQQLLSGTNIGDAAWTVLTRESSNMLAGMIVFSDGQSNQGSPSTYEELRRRAVNLKVPIFAIGVGEVREQIMVRITDLQAPEQGPPDEKFMIRVEVDGEGLADKEFEVILDIYKPGDPKTPVMQVPGKGKFTAAGGLPHGHVEFVIDPAADEFGALREATQSGKHEFIEGEWKFVARIPKIKGEAFAGKEHVSDEARVQIVKKPLRVLLFAGGPTREYQFTRRLFVNEVDKNRAELSIFLQVNHEPGKTRVQDLKDPNRMLKAFPNVLRVDEDPTEKPEDMYYNLARYDLIIAFDPDWTQVPRESLDLLQKWVDIQAGGLIVVGGPIHTFKLAYKDNLEPLRPVIDVLPVRVEHSVLAGLNVERTTTRPWRLDFPGVTNETEYLRIDESKKQDVRDGWELFFTGRDKWSPNPNETPLRGFFSYYPVKSVKPTATVMATFTDPKARLMKDEGAGSSDEQPFLVTMPYGKGKTMYLSSGEMWRLRLAQKGEMLHERFWTKLGRFAASGTQTKQTRRGSINIGRLYTVGQYVRLNAPMYGSDLNPLPQTAEPVLKVIPPGGGQPISVKLRPRREGEWSGQFEGQFQVNLPGEYQLEIPVPGSSEILRSKTQVKESNPEMDQTRPNFALLRNQVAGYVSHLRVGDAAKKALADQLRSSVSVKTEAADKAAAPPEDLKGDVPLFFDLKDPKTKSIPDYLKGESRTQKNRGPVEDLWPAGPTMSFFGFGKSGVVGTVLLVVVGLLSVEWLTRKLLKLA